MYSHDVAAMVYEEHSKKTELANREAWKYEGNPLRPSRKMREMLRSSRSESDR